MDHPSYVVNKGGADIFFPVDVFLLRDLYRYLAQRDDRVTGGKGRSARVVKSARFLHEFADVAEAETRSGYNPLMEDFRNTCVFLADAGGVVAVGGGGGGGGEGKREEQPQKGEGEGKEGR